MQLIGNFVNQFGWSVGCDLVVANTEQWSKTGIHEQVLKLPDCVDWFEAVAWLRMENIVAIIIMCEDRFGNALQNCPD